MNKAVFHKSDNFKRPLSRVRTRYISFLALLTSIITFTSGLYFALFMKGPNFENQFNEIMNRPDFENQFYREIMKRLTPIINYEIEKRFEEVN